MAESYEVVERFGQDSARPQENHIDGSKQTVSRAPATPSTPRSTASPRPGSRAQDRTASPAPSQRQRQSSNIPPASPASPASPPHHHQIAPPPPSKALSKSQRISNLIQRQYIYFTTLLQEPEPKWKPVTDSRGVTVSQLDSIDRNLVVYRAEATFVGVAVWDLFAAISTPGVRKAWEPNADEDRLLQEVRLPESAAGADGGAASASASAAGAGQSGTGPAQLGNNSRSGLSRRTANGPPSQLWHFKQRAAWPVAARDSVLLSTTYRSQDCSSAHHFSFSTSDKVLFPAIPPPTQGTIRSQVDLRGWSIEALNPTTAHVTLIEQSDPKGWTTKSSSIPTNMVSAVAGVGSWAIKNGGPPIVTHLSAGAVHVVSKYESDKGRYRLEYELDRSSPRAEAANGSDASTSAIPPVIECELRCDLDLWSSNLDLIIDPPPIHVSVVRRPRLSRKGAGAGLWLTIEHASASLGALNAGDDDDDDLSDDVARITVRKGDGITSEAGVVLINGARMSVEVEATDEEAQATISRAQRSKPKRAPLDQNGAPKARTLSTSTTQGSRPINIENRSAGPETTAGSGNADDDHSSRSLLDDDISQALAEHVVDVVATADQSSRLESKASALDGASLLSTSPGSITAPTGSATESTSATISRCTSPGARAPLRRSTSAKEANLATGEAAKAIGVQGRASPRVGDRPYSTLRERDGNRNGDNAHGVPMSATSSSLSTSFASSSPMMNVLSRLSAVSTATSSITNTQASGQLRIASGVEPPNRSPTIELQLSRSSSAEGVHNGAGGSDVSVSGAGTDKDGKLKVLVTGTSNSKIKDSNSNNNNNHDTIGGTVSTAATTQHSQASKSTTSILSPAESNWKWFTKGTWLPKLGTTSTPVPRDSSSAAAAVLAEDEKRKQERDKAAAKAAAKAKKSGKGVAPDAKDASTGDAAVASASPDASTSNGGGAEGDASPKTAADVALAAAGNAMESAQTGVMALRNNMSNAHFSLPTLILTAVIAFLFGSLARALLSPADFVLLPSRAYDVSDVQQVQQGRSGIPGLGLGRGGQGGKGKEPASSVPSSKFNSQLSRLLQDVLSSVPGVGSGSSSSSSADGIASVDYQSSVATQATYGRDEVEQLLLKALQAGVQAGGQLQHDQGSDQYGTSHSHVRNVSWREIKRLIEFRGLMAGWDLVIAVVRR